MNILVLNGSPKGQYSITFQTSLYLQKRFQNHTFETLNIAQKINLYAKNLTEVAEKVEKADLIIFSYPVYTFLAPYQMHKFIEIVKEKNIDFSGKFATQISTSKHFFDTTAHKFIEENCYDLGLKYIRGLSADMDDLMTDKGRKEADDFMKKVLFDVENDIFIKEPKINKNINTEIYQKSFENVQKTLDKDVVIVTNVAEDDVNLQNMIDDFVAVSKNNVRVANVRQFKFASGCIGCLGCTTTASCIFKDKFEDYLRKEIQNADSIVYAFSIENHYTHSSFKCYDDRQFCNGHRSVTHGMPVGYIISGDYSNETNVKTIVEARSDVGGVYLSGVATDEYDTKKAIKDLASSLEFTLENKLSKSTLFYGVGGTKIFRDLVYLMQGMMKADHKFYKENGIYDFPQKKKMKILQMKIIGSLMASKGYQKKMKGKTNEFIVSPYKKLIEKTEPMVK